MARIKVLDDQLANQIAAGEVVERPASVVKELVENAVDAGSTLIDISLEEGGLSYIRVVDNGYGIEASDITAAFQRHATSKISKNSDLFRILSLGFRGEALPSIAAVSRLTCISSDTDSGLGRRIVIEGGNITLDEPFNAQQGTDITVRDLFYNTPARLKYMKALQTELGHITDYINRIALAHPGISFTLKHNGNVLLRTLGTGDRLQVIAAIYGTNTAKTMLSVEGESPDYELRGYISKPELTRANRNGITAIVNGRYIRSFMINQALLQAYHTLLPINRYPLAVIELSMHPSLLDVNVHPSKLEVRFSKEPELRQLIESAVKELLANYRYIPGPEASQKREREKPLFVQDSISFHRPLQNAEQPFSGSASREAAVDSNKEYVPRDAVEKLYAPPTSSVSAGDELRERPNRTNQVTGTSNVSAHQVAATSQVSTNPGDIDHDSVNAIQPLGQQAAAPPEEHAARFPELYWIGQHHGTYLIAESLDGLYLIDQHAAHERINYEYFYTKFGNPEASQSAAACPVNLRVHSGREKPRSCNSFSRCFFKQGVELEPFGAHTFLVRSSSGMDASR